jgi:hypothetical protein
VRLDWRAVGIGALLGLAVAVPGAVLGGVTDVVAFAVFVFAGFVLAGVVAASKGPSIPFTHGIVAGVVVWAVVQGIGTILVVAKGDDLHPLAYVFNGFLAAGLGLLGGLIAERRVARASG